MFKKSQKVLSNGRIGEIMVALQDGLNSGRAPSKEIANIAMSFESVDSGAIVALESAQDDLTTLINNVVSQFSMESAVTTAQVSAAVMGGIIAADPKGFFSRRVDVPTAGHMSSVVTPGYVTDTMTERMSMESYDMSENRNAVARTIAYNMQAPLQNEFGELFYPTITIPNDMAGLSVVLPLFQVHNDVVRGIDGKLDNYNKKNIIRAYTDPTILKNDQTRAIPVVRPESVAEGVFTPAALIPAYAYDNEGVAIQTAPLRPGKELNLIGLCQTDQTLARGSFDVTDALAPGITLTAVYVKLGDDIVKLKVDGLFGSNFVYAVQGLNRRMQLNFETTSLVIDKTTKLFDGSALGDLAVISTADLSVRVKVAASGNTNLELGNTVVYGNAVSLATIRNAAGIEIAQTDASVATIVSAFANASIVGYDLKAWLINSNRRQRGQLTDVSYWTQTFNVMPRSPVSSIHPTNTDTSSDAADMGMLVSLTQLRTANAAIDAFFDQIDNLRNYRPIKDGEGRPPEMLGIGSFFVMPQFMEASVDMEDYVDSLKSSDRRQDIQAALVDKIRDMAYQLYVKSEYGPANMVLSNNTGVVPTLAIVTDPYTAAYLMIDGDLRTTGPSFPVKVVTTNNIRMRGKIGFSFVSMTDNRNTEVNPLNFGNMIWQPEVVAALQVSRDGSTSRELAVSPSFLHINNLPVAGMINVSNIETVLKKVPVLNTPTP